MRKRFLEPVEDIYECKREINKILADYNCTILSADEWHSVIMTSLHSLKIDLTNAITAEFAKVIKCEEENMAWVDLLTGGVEYMKCKARSCHAL
jgi:hypothetical protein